MVINIKQLSKEKYLLPGNAACPGCPEALGLKYLGMALGDKVILVVPAGCSSVIQGLAPGSSFKFPTLNVPFASADAVASGLAAAKEIVGEDAHVVVWAGDGGTADIGMAALSGAAERNDNIIHICVDNEAYMNTGIQRSSLTPYGAWTTTTWTGKKERKKELPLIMLAHKVPYVATASVAYPTDFIEKLRKAATIKGFKYIHLHAPCPVGWRFDPKYTVRVAKLAVETGMWILFEAVEGEVTISPFSKPYMQRSRRKPIEEYIKLQGRFKPLKKEHIEILKELIDDAWETLLKFSK